MVGAATAGAAATGRLENGGVYVVTALPRGWSHEQSQSHSA
jgi:hypothetical protein